VNFSRRDNHLAVFFTSRYQNITFILIN